MEAYNTYGDHIGQWKPVLRIRVELTRIRIRSSRKKQDPDPTFRKNMIRIQTTRKKPGTDRHGKKKRIQIRLSKKKLIRVSFTLSN